MMSISGLAAPLFEATAFARLAKVAASSLLGLAVCGWVAGHCGPSTGEVVVHVTEANVEVAIDDEVHQVGGLCHEPIVRELPGGRHELEMRRGGRILHEESFEVQPGESIVLTAWDPEGRRAGAAACSPPASSRAAGDPQDRRSPAAAGPCPRGRHGTCVGRPDGAGCHPILVPGRTEARPPVAGHRADAD